VPDNLIIKKCLRSGQVLAEGEQIRQEADNIGPRAELDHWKKRTSKFNFLLEQLKSHRIRAVTGILQSAKSKLLPVGEWNRITIFEFIC